MDTVLFLCYNNAGRSLMAEAIFNNRAALRGIEAHAESAGLLGVGATNPMFSRCLEEIGVSLEGSKPKQISKEIIERSTRIVAFGRITSDHGGHKFQVAEGWEVTDPAGLAFGELRTVRDDIVRQVDELLDRYASKTLVATA